MESAGPPAAVEPPRAGMLSSPTGRETEATTTATAATTMMVRVAAGTGGGKTLEQEAEGITMLLLLCV